MKKISRKSSCGTSAIHAVLTKFDAAAGLHEIKVGKVGGVGENRVLLNFLKNNSIIQFEMLSR